MLLPSLSQCFPATFVQLRVNQNILVPGFSQIYQQHILNDIMQLKHRTDHSDLTQRSSHSTYSVWTLWAHMQTDIKHKCVTFTLFCPWAHLSLMLHLFPSAVDKAKHIICFIYSSAMLLPPPTHTCFQKGGETLQIRSGEIKTTQGKNK